MSPWLILAIAVVYIIVSADLFYAGKAGLALAFLGYAIGNIGLWVAAR